MTGMEEIIDISIVKDVLIMAIIAMYFVVTILLIVVLAHKAYVEIMERRYLALKKHYAEAFATWLFGSAKSLPSPATHPQHEAWAEVLIDYLNSMKGDIESKIKECISLLGLDVYYKHMASSRAHYKRYMAIEKIGLFRMEGHKDLLSSLILTDPDMKNRAKACEALSLIARAEEDIMIISRALSDSIQMSSKFNECMYSNIIKSFQGAGLDKELLDIMDRLLRGDRVADMLKKDIIEAFGSEGYLAAKPLIMDFYERVKNENPSLKITCIRSMGRLGGYELCSIIRENIADPDWTVRAVSVKNAYLCSDVIVDDLKETLHDRNYYVRINSAMSLARLGEKGVDALREATESPDKFTRDVAKYILQETLSNVA